MNSASVRRNLALEGQPVPSWPVQAFQLVTLWDMLPFLADIFYFTNHRLDALRCELKHKAKDAFLSHEDIEAARFNFNALKSQCEKVGFAGVVKRLEDIEVMFIEAEYDANKQVSVDRLRFQLEELHTALARDLSAQTFMTIAVSDVGYYNQEQLFGPEVYANFWSARDDVTAAGNCYATGNYTACAFHCARVAEKGLHALARDMNNRFGVVVSFGDKEIERVNWGNLIQKIEKEVERLLDPNRQPKIAPDDVVFYSQTAKEFSYLKNGWRDEISHSRTFYKQPLDAKVFMDHVKTFMTYLAKQGLTE